MTDQTTPTVAFRTREVRSLLGGVASAEVITKNKDESPVKFPYICLRLVSNGLSVWVRVSTLLGLQNTVEPYLRWEYAFSGMPQGLQKRLTVCHGPERGL
jgi:hypothetical protein